MNVKIFESAKKKFQIQKYLDTCGHGLRALTPSLVVPRFERFTKSDIGRGTWVGVVSIYHGFSRKVLSAYPIDHFTVVAKLPGLRMEARLPVTLP